MTRTKHLISIKTLTDSHLESFITCPNKFYHQYILSKNSHQFIWRQMVEFLVHKIIHDYYRLPFKEQNQLNVLRLIDQYRKYLHPRLFESKIQYYITLAKITDHLLLFLTSNRGVEPPIFLYERHKVSVEELKTNLSITIDRSVWSENQFSINKYFLDFDERIITLYKYLLIVFSKKAFGVLPDQIELFSLLDGSRHSIIPAEHDVAKGLMYLEMVKGQLQQPEYYLKCNCNQCSEYNSNKELNHPEVQKEDKSNLLTASFKTILH